MSSKSWGFEQKSDNFSGTNFFSRKTIYFVLGPIVGGTTGAWLHDI